GTRGYVVRWVGEGSKQTVVPFSTYGPKIIAQIGQPPTTIVDRSIRVPLRRARRNANIDRLRLDRLREFRHLNRKARRWAEDNINALGSLDPEVPDRVVSDRDRDNWRPLLAVADRAGGEWPRLAREAAGVLCGNVDDSQSYGEMLLSDIRDYFQANSGFQYAETADLIKYLVSLEDRPWPEFGKSAKPITPHTLARLLRDF